MHFGEKANQGFKLLGEILLTVSHWCNKNNNNNKKTKQTNNLCIFIIKQFLP